MSFAWPHIPDQSIKGLTLAVVAVLWFTWALIPIYVLVQLSRSAGPAGLLRLTDSWYVLVTLWTVSLVCLFIYLVWCIFQSKSSTVTAVTECSLGILCSLSLGLPSILLGAVPFFALNMTSVQQLFPHGNIVDLQIPAVTASRQTNEKVNAEAGKPNVYVVGVDVSDSFLKSRASESDAPSAEDEPPLDEERLEWINQTILELFSEGGFIGDKWQPGDVLKIWTFAGRADRAWRKDAESNEKERTLGMLSEGTFKDHVRQNRHLDHPENTNIVGFLNTAVLDDLAPGKYHQAKIILFTDLEHVEKANGYISPEKTDKIEAKIVKLADRIKKNPDVAVVAFTVPANKAAGEKGAPEDIGVWFNGRLKLRNWQSIDLAHFRERNPVEKNLDLIALHGDVRDAGTIYLKYIASRDNECIPSYLLLNEDTSRVVVGLRKRDNIRRSDDDAREYMRVGVGAGHSLRWIALDGAEPSAQALTLLKSDDVHVPVELEPGFGLLGNFPAELLVAIPPDTIYRVPIIVLPIEDVEVDTVDALGLILLALNLIPLGLAILSVIFKYQELFAEPRV